MRDGGECFADVLMGVDAVDRVHMVSGHGLHRHGSGRMVRPFDRTLAPAREGRTRPPDMNRRHPIQAPGRGEKPGGFPGQRIPQLERIDRGFRLLGGEELPLARLLHGRLQSMLLIQPIQILPQGDAFGLRNGSERISSVPPDVSPKNDSTSKRE